MESGSRDRCKRGRLTHHHPPHEEQRAQHAARPHTFICSITCRPVTKRLRAPPKSKARVFSAPSDNDARCHFSVANQQRKIIRQTAPSISRAEARIVHDSEADLFVRSRSIAFPPSPRAVNNLQAAVRIARSRARRADQETAGLLSARSSGNSIALSPPNYSFPHHTPGLRSRQSPCRQAPAVRGGSG